MNKDKKKEIQMGGSPSSTVLDTLLNFAGNTLGLFARYPVAIFVAPGPFLFGCGFLVKYFLNDSLWENIFFAHILILVWVGSILTVREINKKLSLPIPPLDDDGDDDDDD